MGKYNPNKPRQWTCASAGLKTGKRRTSSSSTGNQEKTISPTTGPNTTRRYIIPTSDHKSYPDQASLHNYVIV
eukprot:CCRYP_021141-RF/>CCRYP_021141-RF protein AED:0.47 eAED:0.47 QI:0/-1/0/1/-1/0/1/0/72